MLGGKVFALVKAYSVSGFIWSIFSRQNIKLFSFHVPRYCLCLLISIVHPRGRGIKTYRKITSINILHSKTWYCTVQCFNCVVQKHRNVKRGKTDFNNFVEEIFFMGSVHAMLKEHYCEGCRIWNKNVIFTRTTCLPATRRFDLMGIENRGTLSTIAYPTFEQLANREESVNNGALLIFPTRQVFYRTGKQPSLSLSLSLQSVSFQLHFSLIFSFH